MAAGRRALWLGLAGSLLLGPLLALAWFYFSLPEIPALTDPESQAAALRVYDRRGRLITQLSVQTRVPVALEQTPRDLRNAVLALEDRSFFSHRGVDLKGVARALLVNLDEGRLAQGASTLTQQLARQLFLSSERSFARKIREAMLAIQIENRYSKEEILALYLNQVYFGNGAYGVQAAARTYFGKHVAELDLAECALLAAIPRSPNRNNPIDAPERALARRNAALRTMLELEMVSPERAKAAALAPLEPAGADPNVAPYFVEAVRQELEARYGAEAVYKGGLAAYTTLDLGIQDAAQAASEAGLARAEARTRSGLGLSPQALRANPLQSALVAMEPSTGAVLAMVGGRDFRRTKFNRATQGRRQPGSAFKPFIYAAAMEQGHSAADIVDDAPTLFRGGEGEEPWAPDDFDRDYLGPISLRRALALSRNIVTVKLMAGLGLSRTIAYVRRFGFQGRLTRDLSLALGTSEVTPLELTAAYCAFANQGLRVSPWLVTRVEDRQGRVLERRLPRVERAIPATTAALLADMLRSVVDGGTGYAVRRAGYRGNAAGKTGTSSECQDAWFVGFTPEVVAGVWLGYDRRTPFTPHSNTGAEAAAPLWADFMLRAGLGASRRAFPLPPGLAWSQVCRASGLPCDAACAQCGPELFVDDGKPRLGLSSSPAAIPDGFLTARNAATAAELQRIVAFHLKVLERRPRGAASWRELGEAHLRLGRTEEAWRCFGEYLKLADDPRLAEWLRARRRPDSAAAPAPPGRVALRAPAGAAPAPAGAGRPAQR